MIVRVCHCLEDAGTDGHIHVEPPKAAPKPPVVRRPCYKCGKPTVIELSIGGASSYVLCDDCKPGKAWRSEGVPLCKCGQPVMKSDVPGWSLCEACAPGQDWKRGE